MKTCVILLSYSVIILKLSLIFGCKMVCYYDTTSSNRVGPAKFTSRDLDFSLQFCTHVIYGFASITPETFVVTTLTSQQDQELANMLKFKIKYPHIKFLLSISGDKSVKTTKKFIHLLEAIHQAQQLFVKSVAKIVHMYEFDGLSLDFPLPTERPVEIVSKYGKLWQKFKSYFHKSTEDNYLNVDHKAQLTDLVQQVSAKLKQDQLMLTLTVLPNTDIKLYFDIPAIAEYLDFIILSSFDFYTPERNPKEADYTAPIKPLTLRGHRLPQANVKHQAQLWHHQQVPRSKIIIGVAAWGRSWKMSKDSNNDGIPPVMNTKGPAAAGPQTNIPGLFSWPEICQMLKTSSYGHNKKGTVNAFQRVVDPFHKRGNYAFRPANENGKNGMWISYEDPLTAASKAEYVRNHNLGGVALFDLSLDDFAGDCSGDKFPILRSIKSKLLL